VRHLGQSLNACSIQSAAFPQADEFVSNVTPTSLQHRDGQSSRLDPHAILIETAKRSLGNAPGSERGFLISSTPTVTVFSTSAFRIHALRAALAITVSHSAETLCPVAYSEGIGVVEIGDQWRYSAAARGDPVAGTKG
jgi:hypothetical protein